MMMLFAVRLIFDRTSCIDRSINLVYNKNSYLMIPQNARFFIFRAQYYIFRHLIYETKSFIGYTDANLKLQQINEHNSQKLGFNNYQLAIGQSLFDLPHQSIKFKSKLVNNNMMVISNSQPLYELNLFDYKYQGVC